MLNINSTETSIPWDDPYWSDEDEIEKSKNMETSVKEKQLSSLDTKKVDDLSVIDERTEVSETNSNCIEKKLTITKNSSSNPTFVTGPQLNCNEVNKCNQRNSTLEYDRQSNGRNRNYNEQRNMNSNYNRNHNQKIFNNDFNENCESFSEITNSYPNKKNYNNRSFSNASKNQFKRDTYRQNQKNNKDRYSRHVSVNSSTFDKNIKIELRHDPDIDQNVVDMKTVSEYEKEIEVVSNDLKLVKVDCPTNEENTKDGISEKNLPKDIIELENESTEQNQDEVNYSVNLEIKSDTPKRPPIQIYNINNVKGKWSNLFDGKASKILKLADQKIIEPLSRTFDDRTSYKFRSLNQDNYNQRNNRTNHSNNKINMPKNDSNNNSKDSHKINNNNEDEIKGNQNAAVKNNDFRNKDKSDVEEYRRIYDHNYSKNQHDDRVNDNEFKSNQNRSDIRGYKDCRRNQDNKINQKVSDNTKEDEPKFNQNGNSYSNDKEFRNDNNGKNSNFHNSSRIISHPVRSKFQNESEENVENVKDNLRSNQIEIDNSGNVHFGKKQNYEASDQEFRNNSFGKNHRSQSDYVRKSNDRNRPNNYEFRRHLNNDRKSKNESENIYNVSHDDRVSVPNTFVPRDLEKNQIFNNDHRESYQDKSLIVNKNEKDNVVDSGFKRIQNDLSRRNDNRRENTPNKDFRRSDKKDFVYNDPRKSYDDTSNDSRRYYDNKGNTVNNEFRNIQNARDNVPHKQYDNTYDTSNDSRRYYDNKGNTVNNEFRNIQNAKDNVPHKQYDNTTFVVNNDLRRYENIRNTDFQKSQNEKSYEDDKKIVRFQNRNENTRNPDLKTLQTDRVFHNRNYKKFITEETDENRKYHKSTNNEYSKVRNGNDSHQYKIDNSKLADADHLIKSDNKEPLMENCNVYNSKNSNQKTQPQFSYDRNNEFRKNPNTNYNTSNNGFPRTNNARNNQAWEKNNENNSNQNTRNFRNHNSNFSYEAERYDEERKYPVNNKNFRNPKNTNLSGNLSINTKPVYEENSRNIKNDGSNQ